MPFELMIGGIWSLVFVSWVLPTVLSLGWVLLVLREKEGRGGSWDGDGPSQSELSDQVPQSGNLQAGRDFC